MGHAQGPKGPRAQVMAMLILHWKNETSVSENGVSQPVQYTNIHL